MPCTCLKFLSPWMLMISGDIVSAPLDVLARLEKLLDATSAEPWSYCRLPTPTALLPVIVDSEEEDESNLLRSRGNNTVSNISNNVGKLKLCSFFPCYYPRCNLHCGIL